MTDHPGAQELFEKVAARVAAQKNIDAATISPDSRFEDLGVDSLDAMEILFELEEEFDLNIPDRAARAMRTVHDVVDGLGKLIRGEEIVLPEPPAAAAGGDAGSAHRSAGDGGAASGPGAAVGGR